VYRKTEYIFLLRHSAFESAFDYGPFKRAPCFEINEIGHEAPLNCLIQSLYQYFGRANQVESIFIRHRDYNIISHNQNVKKIGKISQHACLSELTIRRCEMSGAITDGI
jgi:hypothetical protein